MPKKAHIINDETQWFADQCEKVGGSVIVPNLCYVTKTRTTYSYFLTPPPRFLMEMDQSIVKYRKWWWIGIILILILFPLITFQWWGWQSVNGFFIILIAFAFIVYGIKISKTWITLSIVTTVFAIAALIYLIYTVIVYNIWYPPLADIWLHLIFGFALYIIVSIFKPKWNILAKFIGAMLLGIFYEMLEWICSSFETVPLLWWDLPNTLYDLQNNAIGIGIAIVLEIAINRWNYRQHKETVFKLPITHEDIARITGISNLKEQQRIYNAIQSRILKGSLENDRQVLIDHLEDMQYK